MDTALPRSLLLATLLLAASAGAGEPRPLNLVWSLGGFPSVFTRYALCGTAAASGAECCLPQGHWVGLCSPRKERANPKRFEGALSLVEGTPRVPGCDEHAQLLWQGAATKPGAQRERLLSKYPGDAAIQQALAQKPE